MSKKTFNTRLVNKHDVEANWLKAVNFVPMQGEIVVYDIDDNYNYERFKIGDGKTLVSDLPFASVKSWDELTDRPFGESVSEGAILENEPLVDESGDGSSLTIQTAFILTAGETYTVNWNGADYECVASEVDVDSVPCIGLGNMTEFGGTGEELPFMILLLHEDYREVVGVVAMAMSLDGVVPDHVSIYGTVVNVTKIDEKFLPAGRNSNLVNGSAMGSVRSITAFAEDDEYVMEYGAAAFGSETKASGENSFACGNLTVSSGLSSHAEGNSSVASGFASHAEGLSTTASGSSSHAEGDLTTASAMSSHAEGRGTIADRNYQHVSGKYNISTAGLVVVGNGDSDDARSNAYVLDGNGNAWFAGDVYVDSTSGTNKDGGSKRLATVDELQNGGVTVSHATSADSATKATQDGNGKVIATTYETKSDASDKLVEAKGYTDQMIGELSEGFDGVIRQMYADDITEDGAPTIREIAADEVGDALADAKSYADSKVAAIDYPVDSVNGKTGAVTLTYTDVGAAASSHGAHVTYSTTAPVMDGTASAGSAATVARSDHKHPADTSRVPTSRTINGKALSANITLSASDVGADASGAAATALANAKTYADDKIEELTGGDVSVGHATGADSATKATQDASGNVITTTYETKSDASAKLAEAKAYADDIKDDLLNGAGAAYDTLKELGDLIDTNADAIDALETVASGKANASHTHGNITNAGAIGTVANKAVVTTTNGVLTTGIVPIASGGTGATTAAGALTNLGITATAAELNKLDGLTASTTELNFVDGVTSKIQTQLNKKPGLVVAGTEYTINDTTVVAGSYAEVFNYTNTNIASGAGSHAEGQDTTASGECSHAEGFRSTASGIRSHAEGWSTTASGDCSHAEGQSTNASGSRSHSEGRSAVASGDYSHAEGYYTIAESGYQHVQGCNNCSDGANKYAHIVGNGMSFNDDGSVTLGNKSNAHTLDWDGNAWFAGDVYVGSTYGTNKDIGSKKLITADELPTKISDLANDSGFITTADIPEGAAASTTAPKMDGTATVGTELAFARGDHVHPSDTSRVPVTRTVNGKALSSNITLSASDVNADAYGAASSALSSAKSYTDTSNIDCGVW